jgi:DNA-binding GntR family transcriptional regulator
VNIVVRSLAEQAYEMVLARILLGQMAPGTPVRQDAIALELGVSKIPLREALTRLEQDGLVSSHPNRGFVVRHLSADEAEEVFTLRLKIEPDAVAAACRVATPEDRARLLLALTALEEKQGNGHASSHVALNRAFHLALVRPGAGLVTLQMVERLHILAERYIHVHLQSVDRHGQAAVEHRALMGAWFDGDAERTATLTAAHIRGTLDNLRGRLSR